ncbi:811fdbe2-c826-4dfc-afe8-ad64afe023b6 [Thermothielavioides terrestris]|uniref:811fdbe2-c826-4dfc-afe8-ad64afe023b6 n=1 Tax=Thermothielavioides terrestris TaxID=2587410 RepID=A0A3S5CXU6_9PEZI|nr:811fdbe2-c826-4dfc-afe8-ad64afe023b6 [Thermothielavioides terrestris]
MKLAAGWSKLRDATQVLEFPETAPISPAARLLRCTGSLRRCDRCRARGVECVPAPSSRRKRSSQPSSSSRPALEKLGDAPPELVDPVRSSHSGDVFPADGSDLRSSKPPQPPGSTALGTSAGADLLGGDSFGCGFALEDPGDEDWAAGHTDTAPVGVADRLHIEGDELVEAQSGIGITNSGGRDIHQLNESPEDALGSSTSTAAAQSSALSGVTPPPNANRTSSASCSCLGDLVRVVQQLDDDEFRLKTMSLDQVLQLQKWLVFQCCRPLDCPDCLDLPTVHTVQLIICERLTEMFECIHLRIKRTGAILSGRLPSSDPSSAQPTPSPDSHTASASALSDHSHDPVPPVPPPPPPPSASAAAARAAFGSKPLPAQLFCGLSGRAANRALCSPLMFSDELRAQYSDEEQAHMIRVLLRLQVKYFQKLLLRVESTRQVAESRARRSRVQSMMARLAQAAADIEVALRVVFQALSAGGGQ